MAAGLAAAAAILVFVAVQQRPSRARQVARAEAGQTMTIGLGGRDAAALPPNATVAGNRQSAANVTPLQDDRQAAPRAPSVIRTARLHMVTKEFAAVRESVEAIVTTVSGFVDQMTLTGETSTARSLRGTLRVPSARLREALTGLRKLGAVLEDTQGTQDVTDQIVDLDARIANARATEQRLTELLRTRTGRLSDVLEIEREVTRVRLEIERLTAEKTNVTRRVDYATIDIVITDERKESLDGPLSFTTRMRIAALDGVESAFESIAAVVLFLLRAGPSLLLWVAALGLAFLAVRRLRDSRPAIQDPR
jgi:hypothetical protein